uniref:RNA polymerase subunit H/Rpb5 C-terminal domain-containing protein n=1 Tax=Arcella intermedia TaxID=1963864 RepID=A0A6B2LIE0_9EUKA
MYQVKRTLAELLKDRGYIVPAQELEMTLSEFKERYGETAEREDMTGLYRKRESQGDQIYVFFAKDEGKPTGVKNLEEYHTRMNQQKVTRAILILHSRGITPFGKQGIAKLQITKNIIIEQFTEEEMLVNITRHNLVPKHVVLTENEKEAVITKYKVTESQLPKMQVSDPIARYFGLQRGAVVKIFRPSETAGRYVTYRLVV